MWEMQYLFNHLLYNVAMYLFSNKRKEPGVGPKLKKESKITPILNQMFSFQNSPFKKYQFENVWSRRLDNQRPLRLRLVPAFDKHQKFRAKKVFWTPIGQFLNQVRRKRWSFFFALPDEPLNLSRSQVRLPSKHFGRIFGFRKTKFGCPSSSSSSSSSLSSTLSSSSSSSSSSFPSCVKHRLLRPGCQTWFQQQRCSINHDGEA